MKLSDAAQHVVDLARKVYDYYTAELPKYHPNYPLVDPAEKEPPVPPEENELRKYLLGLPADILYQLILIMHLGRGDFGADDLAEHFEELNGDFPDSENAARYLLNKATLADDVVDGLEELRKHRINVDKMPLKKVKARKR